MREQIESITSNGTIANENSERDEKFVSGTAIMADQHPYDHLGSNIQLYADVWYFDGFRQLYSRQYDFTERLGRAYPF